MKNMTLQCLRTSYHERNINAAFDRCILLLKKKKKKEESFAVLHELY